MATGGFRSLAHLHTFSQCQVSFLQKSLPQGIVLDAKYDLVLDELIGKGCRYFAHLYHGLQVSNESLNRLTRSLHPFPQEITFVGRVDLSHHEGVHHRDERCDKVS